MRELSVREKQKFKDISWVMPNVDVEKVLSRLGIIICDKQGDGQYLAFCPDHEQFTGRAPSHPKWVLSPVTGECYCVTEGRGSNLLWTIVRVLKCTPDEALNVLVDGAEIDITGLKMHGLKNRMLKMQKQEMKAIAELPKLDDIVEGIANRYISERCYQYFMSPPGKKPTNIRKETVDHYQVFERTWGFFSNRAVVPFFLRGTLVGFCAIDLIGEENWLRNNPDKTKGDYRKTRFPANFKSGEYLFGIDDCKKNADLLFVVEGPREVMKLWQEGYTNAVAVLGSNLTTFGESACDSQIILLAGLCPKKVVLMFDGDDAGVRATEKLEKALSRLFTVVPCYLPRGKDPKNLDGDTIKKLLESHGIA